MKRETKLGAEILTEKEQDTIELKIKMVRWRGDRGQGDAGGEKPEGGA